MSTESRSPASDVPDGHAWPAAVWWAAPVGIYLLSATCCICYGNLNADEGWILNAARQVINGLIPHRDFAYTQGPLQPYLYGLLLGPVGINLLSGRVLTALLGLGALLLSMRLAGQISGNRWAGVLAGLFVALNFEATYHNTITKTHALVGLLVTAGVWLAVTCARWSRLGTLLTVVIAAAAVATRLAALPVAGLLVLWMWWRGHDRRVLVVGVLVALVAAAGWTATVGADRLWFNLVRYHIPDPASVYAPVTWSGQCGAAVQTVCAVLWHHTAMLLPVAMTLLWGYKDHEARPLVDLRREDMSAAWLAVGAGALLFLAHLPGRGFGTLYMSMSLPVMACGASVIAVRLRQWVGERNQAVARLFGVALAGLLLFTAAFPSLEMVRLTCNFSAPDVPALRQTARYLAALTPTDRPVLTLHTYLAVEAHRPVPAHYSMSIFSYQPALTTEQCLRLGAVNDALLVKDLQDPAIAAVAVTARDVQMLRAPHQVVKVLRERWERMRTVSRFGHWHDEMAILLPRAGNGG